MVRTSLIRANRATSKISERFDLSSIQFPLHPGARSYYDRDKPSFLVTYSETMAFILSLLIAMLGLSAAVRQWISQRKKDRIDRYYLAINDLQSRLSSQDLDESVLRDIETELSKMRHNALQELVDEYLVADESFRIFQSLLSDCQWLAHSRLSELLPVNSSSRHSNQRKGN